MLPRVEFCAKAFRAPCLASPPLTFPDLGLLRGALTAAARLQPSQARALCGWVLHLLQLYSSYNLGQVPAQCNFPVARIESYDGQHMKRSSVICSPLDLQD